MPVEALEDRTACLIASLGKVPFGTDVGQAVWHAVELETIAMQCHLARLAGQPVILSDEEVLLTIERFADYGQDEV